MRLSDDGQTGVYLETSKPSHSLAVFDTATARVTRRIPLGENVRGAASFSSDLKYAVILRSVDGSCQAERWNTTRGVVEDIVRGIPEPGELSSDDLCRWTAVRRGKWQYVLHRSRFVNWTEAELVTFQGMRKISATAVAFSTNADRVFLAAKAQSGTGDSRLMEFSLTERKLVQQQPLDCDVLDLVMNRSSGELLGVGDDRRLRRIRIDDLKVVLRGDRLPYGIGAISLSRDESTIAVGGQTGIVDEFDAVTLERKARHFAQRFQVESVGYGKQGRLWAAGYDGSIRYVNSGKDSRFLSIAGTVRRVQSISLNHDATLLAIGSEKGILLSDARTGLTQATLQDPQPHENFGIKFLTFLNSDTQLLSMSWGGTVRLWDIAKRELIARFAGDNPWGIQGGCLSPDQRYAFSCNDDRTLAIWDVRDRKLLRKVPVSIQHFACAVSPNGQLLVVVGSDYTAPPQIWNVATLAATGELKTVAEIGVRPEAYRSVSFSPDGRFLALGDVFNRVSLVNTTDWKVLWTSLSHLHGVDGIAFSPDSSRLVSCSKGGRVILSETESGQEIMRLNGHTGRVRDVAFSPDGSTIAAAGDDKGVLIWSGLPRNR